jgi:CBS domain-containing protein
MADRDPLEYQDEAYFEPRRGPRVFDSQLLRERVTILPSRKPITFAGHDSVTEAVRAMKSEQRGAIAITEDGTPGSPLVGIFTERDVLLRIVDRGKNPATLPLADVMTPDPDVIPLNATVAYALNKMSVGGFRHVPVVDDERRPATVISVRDIVTFLVDAFPREVLNLPVEGRPTAREREGA